MVVWVVLVVAFFVVVATSTVVVATTTTRKATTRTTTATASTTPKHTPGPKESLKRLLRERKSCCFVLVSLLRDSYESLMSLLSGLYKVFISSPPLKGGRGKPLPSFRGGGGGADKDLIKPWEETHKRLIRVS